MSVFERLKQLELFSELSDHDLGRICGEVTDQTLAPGEVLFREGEPGDRAFVICSGAVEIIRSTERREVLIAVRTDGDVIGEMALLDDHPRTATARAREQSDLMSIPQAALEGLLASSPSAARSILGSLYRRVRETNDRLRHHDRMLQLGVMTAGLAHELNNPAAAGRRAADDLVAQVADLATLSALGSSAGLVSVLDDLRVRGATPRTAMETGDHETAVESWLEDHHVDEAWQLAPTLVEAGVETSDLDKLLQDGEVAAGAVRLLTTAASAQQSATIVAAAARRISDVVGRMRSYSYLDQAPVQQVDVVGGIEDTLMLLEHLTREIKVVREYDDDLPRVTAVGSDLNQVWTNLVRNACDALADVAGPVLTIRVASTDNELTVEVEDNGPGIPAELAERVFDAFYTTKAPGQGTGLGLQISYRIVVVEHGGDIGLTSTPGRTTFRVSLPLRPAALEPTRLVDR
jgi:signal transduction histidine kinase